MFSEMHPYIRRVIRFALLPHCYFKLVPWQECTRSRIKVLADLLYVFFVYKYYPENYGPCRFWEKDKNEWRFYYGSSYDPYQRQKLRKFVQRADYRILYEDKELWQQFAMGLQVSLPRYFGVVDPGGSYKEKIKTILDEKHNGRIIIKPVTGRAGQGIVLARRTANGIEIKTASQIKMASQSYALDDFKLLERSVVQGFIEQHPAVASIAASSVNTIRLVTLWTMDDDVILVDAYMRFGQDESFVDNVSAGGISVAIDTSTGTLTEYAFNKMGKRFAKHPVSGVVFNKFQIPMWDEVVEMAKVIQKACPFYRLVGCDVAVTESGPVLIEVNAEPDIVALEQRCGPILSDKRVYDEFNKYNLLINKYQKTLYRKS